MSVGPKGSESPPCWGRLRISRAPGEEGAAKWTHHNKQQQHWLHWKSPRDSFCILPPFCHQAECNPINNHWQGNPFIANPCVLPSPHICVTCKRSFHHHLYVCCYACNLLLPLLFFVSIVTCSIFCFFASSHNRQHPHPLWPDVLGLAAATASSSCHQNPFFVLAANNNRINVSCPTTTMSRRIGH